MKLEAAIDKPVSMADTGGFTLIEVLIAMVILGIGIFAVVGLQTNDAFRNNASIRSTEGYAWAMDQVEKLLATPFSDATISTAKGDPGIVGDGYTANQGPYTVEWDVVNNNAVVDNSRVISVFVRWNTTELARLDITRTQSSFKQN